MVERSGTVLLSATDQVKLLLFKLRCKHNLAELLMPMFWDARHLGNREVMIDIANVSTYDKSDNHVLFTPSL